MSGLVSRLFLKSSGGEDSYPNHRILKQNGAMLTKRSPKLLALVLSIISSPNFKHPTQVTNNVPQQM